MPKSTKNKPAQPVKPKAAKNLEEMAAPDQNNENPGPYNPDGLRVVYEKLNTLEYSTTSKMGPLTGSQCKKILGWETEDQYQKRMIAEEPGSKPEHHIYGDVYHCRDVAGKKVRCRNNANNRPFDSDWCEDLIHTVLYGQYAGPHTVPGETVNGETVRVSRYGRVVSGQHQLTACALADEWLQHSRKQANNAVNPKYPVWNGHDEVFIETVVVTGMSEDPRVLMTVDYVKPRTSADVFYTTSTFKNSTPPERKELCRMLAAAVDMLWHRTDTRGYKTHPEIVAFLDRHKKLLNAVEYMFKINSAKDGRRISKLHLSPGQMAALAYIMGSAGRGTDGDTYRNEEPAPSEKNLDWSYRDRAAEFWILLTRTDAESMEMSPVRMALGRLMGSDPGSDENLGMGGRAEEKLAVLAKAWSAWKDDDRAEEEGFLFDMDDLHPDGLLCLNYSDLDDKGNRMPNGQIKLVDTVDFGGIDGPAGLRANRAMRNPRPADPPPPTHEEMERLKEEALKRRDENEDAKVKRKK